MLEKDASAGNKDHRRADEANNRDDPVGRYIEAWALRRTHTDVQCRKWSQRALPCAAQTCLLCQDRGFVFREDWKKHVDEVHGGVQRYRNALFCLLSLKPYAVRGQEWRAVVANYAEFYASSAVD